MTMEALTGDPTIRWGDKSYNSLVFSDGTFGSNCDVSLFVCLENVQDCKSPKANNSIVLKLKNIIVKGI